MKRDEKFFDICPACCGSGRVNNYICGECSKEGISTGIILNEKGEQVWEIIEKFQKVQAVKRFKKENLGGNSDEL